jgi:hypothetical protein
MSMNLTCHTPDGHRVPLRQTPTEVTERCFGGSGCLGANRDWKEILGTYLNWLDEETDYDDCGAMLLHIKVLLDVVVQYGRLEFSYI